MVPSPFKVLETATEDSSRLFCAPLSGNQLEREEFDRLFERLKGTVLEQKPVLKEILTHHGSKKIYDYAKDYIDVNLNPPIEKRQSELLIVMHDEVKRLLGKEVADSVVRQLPKYYFVSTADHHGPLTHPFFINSNLLIAAPFSEYKEKDFNNVIVLACGAVSQNNSSFPRGVVFHSTGKDRSGHFHAAAFFPAKDRLCPVSGFRPYDAKDLKRLREGLDEKLKDGCLDKPTADRFGDILKDVYEREEIYAMPSYSDQVTRTNFTLWRRILESGGEKKGPNLVYLEVEKIVARLLIDYHLGDDTSIYNFLFNTECHQLIDQYFQSITGTYSIAEKWGTYMFWGLPKGERYRMSLWRQGRELVSENGKHRFALTPESIRKGIESGELIPSTMLVYTVLCFYYGLKCLGGFSQVNYLTFMKNAYIKMQTDRGKYRSIEVCARAQTKEIVGDVNVAYIETPRGDIIPATGIDLIIHGKKDWWKLFIEESKNITLNQAMNPMMPELYTIIFSEKDRRQDLLKISTEDITRYTGLREKIAPCASLL